MLKSSVAQLKVEVLSLRTELQQLKEDHQQSRDHGALNLDPPSSEYGIGFGGEVGQRRQGTGRGRRGGRGGRVGHLKCGVFGGGGVRFGVTEASGVGVGGIGVDRMGLGRVGAGGTGVSGVGRGGVGAGRVSEKNVPAKIRLENSNKIWGTLRSTTPAAIMNVIMKTTSESLASHLTVKRKSM